MLTFELSIRRYFMFDVYAIELAILFQVNHLVWQYICKPTNVLANYLKQIRLKVLHFKLS